MKQCYNATIEKEDVTEVRKGEIPGDKFARLVSSPKSVTSQISVSWGESAPFGRVKVSVLLTLTCDQTEAMIQEAGFLGYITAKELVATMIEDHEKSVPAS